MNLTTSILQCMNLSIDHTKLIKDLLSTVINSDNTFVWHTAMEKGLIPKVKTSPACVPPCVGPGCKTPAGGIGAWGKGWTVT